MSKEASPFGINLTKRFVSEGGEKELFYTHPINSGTVELVDYMGGDETVVRVATSGHGTSIFSKNPSTSGLINYLSMHGIYDPFKSVQLKFNIRSPIATALALVYEQSCNVNEYSGRYSIMLDSSFTPTQDWLEQFPHKPNNIEKILQIFNQNRERTSKNYKMLLDLDMARELARAGLGIDNDTKYFWKMDLFNLARFVTEQRDRLDFNDPTFEYIEQIAQIASDTSPIAWKALTNPERSYPILTMPKDEDVVDPSLNPAQWQSQETKRVIVPALEEVLFQIQPFLDHGEFQVVDYMGDDNSFAEAARISYGEGTKKLQDNQNLTRSLIRDLHTSPIEMSELAMEIKAPMFVDPRQAGRHRTLDKHGFMGYNPLGSQFYIPPAEEFKYQDKVNRQGRGKSMDEGDLEKAVRIYISDKESQLQTVQQLRQLGTPEELTRMSKGVGFYTKMWRSGDANNLSRYLILRLDKHAQKEIREEAKMIEQAFLLHTPTAHEALMVYTINGMRFSSKEIELMIKQQMIKQDLDPDNLENYRGVGFLITDKEKGEQKLSREGLSFQEKLKKLKGN